ncbi:hypothetical protein ElyMa_002200000 [Elysia marginata]|uniref:THAP-type domain-containing protein n=1 Tax=Elysia marginata TaxID=1093978 RepID=A0AAV4FRI8_9GAST|nr:hypothetical protein ElyMa_002200000 [Elysia marginata]
MVEYYSSTEALQELPKMPIITNLVCERHFKHHDANQKRRPHSSLHNHFSVMVLKKTREKSETVAEKQTLTRTRPSFQNAKSKGKPVKSKAQPTGQEGHIGLPACFEKKPQADRLWGHQARSVGSSC